MAEATLTQQDHELLQVLKDLLESDQDITAREVARRHPTLHAASSITRSAYRRGMLLRYQEEQQKLRQWSKRNEKTSGASVEQMLAERDVRIAELETQVEVLVGSHLAMLRAVGELGGFSQWARFFENTAEARAVLAQLGAIPKGEVVNIRERI